MIDFIASETNKIMYKCCERYAFTHNQGIEDVQLILGLNENGNTYTMCENYARKEEYSILQVLGVRIDFKGYSLMAPPFILKSILRFAEKHGVDVDKIFIMCVPFKNEKDKNDIKLFLYNGNEYLETIEFSDLFREEDIEMPSIQ